MNEFEELQRPQGATVTEWYFREGGRMKTKTGGAAFPSPGVVLDTDKNCQRQQGAYEGMSLRDWFAGMAVQGLVASDNYVMDYVVKVAYSIADAMLKEREKNK